MRPNLFKERLEAGERPLMAWMWMPSPLAVEVVCDAGYEAVGIDLQHMGADFDINAAIAVITARGVTPVVRIPHPDDLGWVTRVLDAGARGIICPNVDTPEQAQAFVRACKYPPVGGRGFGPVRAGIGRSVAYEPGPGVYSLEEENESILAFVQIESAEGLDNVEAIVGTDGVDSVFPGPHDLSVSLYGELVEMFDPRMREPLQRVIDASHAAGRTVGLPPFTPDRIPTLVEMGADWFQFGVDLTWLAAGARETVTSARDEISALAV